MLDRASSFSDPEVVELLKNRFVPVAIDQAYERRQKDAEGEFYRKIAGQGPRKPGEETTQGHYVAGPDGEFFGYRNHRDPEVLKDLLKSALSSYKPKSVGKIDPGQVDPKWGYTAPEGGLIVRVHTKILGGYAPPASERSRLFQEGMGRDNLWIRRDEREALADGKVEESLLRRIARFHCVDNTRGEPPMWEENEIVSATLDWNDDHLAGQIHLETAEGDREFKAEIFGYLEALDGEVTRFDIVIKGLFRGEGEFTRGAPEGEFPLGISFKLADGSDVADSISPQGSRGWLENYLLE